VRQFATVVLVATAAVLLTAGGSARAQPGPTLVMEPDCRTLGSEQIYGVKVGASGLAPNTQLTIQIKWTYLVDPPRGGGSTSPATFASDANGNFASFDFSTVGVKTSYTATLFYAGQTFMKTLDVTCEQPISKDQCKNGGWQTYGVFKNQGDCVSFVATNGKNQPSGA
jgi:hypothetical protein